jgi:hypothetical protein
MRPEENSTRRLDTVLRGNKAFEERLDIDRLPTERQSCPYAIVTCMDG